MAESISIDDLPASPANSRILAALARQGGLTREELSRAAYIGTTTLSGGGYLQRLRQQGLIYISGWRRSASGSFSIPQFSLGAGPDYPRPTINLTNRAAAGMERLVEAIRSGGPLDYLQAAAAADLSPNTVKNAGYLDALLAQERIHIDSWRRGRRGAPRPLYMAGPGPDAPRLDALSPREKSRAFRQRNLAVSAADCFADQLRLYLPRRSAIRSGEDPQRRGERTLLDRPAAQLVHQRRLLNSADGQALAAARWLVGLLNSDTCRWFTETMYVSSASIVLKKSLFRIFGKFQGSSYPCQHSDHRL